MTLLDFEMHFNITNHMIATGSWKIRHISNACRTRVKSILMEGLVTRLDLFLLKKLK